MKFAFTYTSIHPYQYGFFRNPMQVLPLAPPLTTWSLTWIHRLFFLTAAMPVVKVFLMLVARRSASWELPSSPAMEPDNTVAPLARPINSPVMFFL